MARGSMTALSGEFAKSSGVHFGRFHIFKTFINLQDRLGCWFCGGQAVWSRQDWGAGGKKFVCENLWNIGCL